MTTETEWRASVLPFTLRYEGGFSADARDPGDWTGGKIGKGSLKGTKYGIAASAHPTLDIARLTSTAAAEIYWRDYVVAPGFDRLAPPLLLVVFDAGVNCGPSRAAAWAKAAANRKGVVAQIAAVTASSLAYHRSLPTWPRYGKGREHRIKACQLRALQLAGARPASAARPTSAPPPRTLCPPPPR